MVTPHGPDSQRAPDEQALTRAAHSSDALRKLLAAAAAPPTTAELKGRSRALAAFRSVYRRRRPGAGAEHHSPPPAVEQQEQADLATNPAEVTDGDIGTDRRRRSRLARARRWSAAQLTLASTALVVLLGTPAARA